MKIKIDFVTNSSSSSYILAFKTNELPEFDDFMRKFTRVAFNKKVMSNMEDVENQFGVLDEEAKEDIGLELASGKTLIYVDVSDELGYGLIECTKFNYNLIYRHGY